MARRAPRCGRSFARTALNKVFPDHWSFMLGEIAHVLPSSCSIVTGVYLTFFFVPDSTQVVYHGSYAPLQRRATCRRRTSRRCTCRFDVRAGLVMRQIHHWAALVFLGAIVVHLLRIFFTGAFRRPREINWVIGADACCSSASPTGSPATRSPTTCSRAPGCASRTRSLLSIPLARALARVPRVRRRVPERRHHLAPVRHPRADRPALIVGLLTVHLAILVRQKHTQFPGRGRDRAQRRRLEAVADVHGQDARPVLLRVRGVRRARRARADQPGLALRPVPAVGGRAPARSPTGTSAGSRARCGCCRRGRSTHRRLRDPEPVLPGRAPARASRSRCSSRGRGSRRGFTKRPRRAPPARPAARPAAFAPHIGVGGAGVLRRAVRRRRQRRHRRPTSTCR